MKQENLIKVGDLCTIVSDKKLKGSGLTKGDELWVATMKPAPEKMSDPYLQRLYAVGLLVRDGELNTEVKYTVDPRNLEKVSEKRLEGFRDEMEVQFKK